MATIERDGPVLRIETDRYQAAVTTEGYTSGVMAGSFVDKRTGARDPGFGLAIIDFLLAPGPSHPDTPEELRYHVGDAYHGGIVKHYVETPQICTQAKTLPYEVVRGEGFVAVRQWFAYRAAPPPYRAGSQWEQWLVFPDGVRWFLAYDRVTSVNSVDALILRMDMPGHLKHQGEETFRQIYLSYEGCLPAGAFAEDFPPQARHLYQRKEGEIPARFIRGYQLANGAWLAGMALDPGVVHESWCHQRGYVCFIHEFGGRPVRAGESFGAVHLIGYFDDVAEMERVAGTHRGAKSLRVDRSGWRLE